MEILLDKLTNVIWDYVLVLTEGIMRKVSLKLNTIQGDRSTQVYNCNQKSLGAYQCAFKYMLVICIMFQFN